MTQLRKVKYKLENSKTSKVGFFHIFKKNISENGSEIILGIIEDEKTGNLFEIQIANFSFFNEALQDSPKKNLLEDVTSTTSLGSFDESEHDDLPY